MTDPRDPDDLASALLDGLLTDDEAAVARRDPAVAAQLAELAAVRDAVRRPPDGPDPAARERGLAAALAAYDSPDEADRPDGAAVGPQRGGRAARPAASRPGTPWRAHGSAHRRWLTAAAVVLVVVGLGVLARNWDRVGDDASTETADVQSSEGGESNAAADQSAGGGTDETAPPGNGSGAIVDLGDVDSPAALTERARVILAGRFSNASGGAPAGEAESGQGTPSAPGASAAGCADDAQAERLAAGSERVALRGRATLDGEPVDVWVIGASGEERVVAVDASCAVVVDQSLQD
jgi:hypothetical protein